MISAPATGEGLGDLHRFLGRHALVAHPVTRRDADRHRLILAPGRTHRPEHLQRPAQAVLQAAAILVGPNVRFRAYEGRDQIAMRRMKFDHVKSGARGHPGRGDELIAHHVHVGPRHRLRHRDGPKLHGRNEEESAHHPASCPKRAGHPPPPSQAACCLAPRMADLTAELRRRLGMDEIGQPLPGRLMLRRVKPRTAGRDPAFRRRRRSSRYRPAPHRPWRVRSNGRNASRSGNRPPPCIAPSATRRRGSSSRMSRSWNGANIG
jgi:hypothetical protein